MNLLFVELAGRRLEEGDRVYWTSDREEGTIAHLTEHAIAIDWDSAGTEWYPISSGALDRIRAFR
jgi:hypothetical protein